MAPLKGRHPDDKWTANGRQTGGKRAANGRQLSRTAIVSIVADAAERLGKLYELDGVTIQRLVVLGLVVKDSDGVQAAFDLVGIIEDAEEANAPNPLAPMVNAMLKTRSTSAGAAMVLVDKSGANLTRYPTPGATATLATWEDSEILAVHVDGAPIASAEPLWRVKPSSVQRPGTQLALLPGDSQAASMISQRMAAIERASIDRRGVLAADTFWLLNLACALTRPLKVSIDELAAWLTGRAGLAGLTPRQREAVQLRAWAGLNTARAWFWLPDSPHPLALLDVDTVGLPRGEAVLKPWDWQSYREHYGGNWRLSGAIANTSAREGGPQAGRAVQLPRLIAGIEDYISASGPIFKGGPARLLIPECKGGPGLVVAVTYRELMARAGWAFDFDNPAEANKAAKVWWRLAERLEANGYVLASEGGEAAAGDTIEILRIEAGRPGPNPARVHLRASARFVEAVRKAGAAKGGGLVGTPLRRLLQPSQG